MDADQRPPRRGAYICGAFVHLLVSAALVAVAYRFFGAQGAAWALGAIFLSCLAVPVVLRRRPGIAASGAGGGAASDGMMELPPKFTFKRDVRAAEGWAQCSICLGLVREGEKVRRLPACGHLFHARCVDKWLRSHPTCPLCRAAVHAAARRPEV
ncbi:hypothetical protein ACQ4PT_059159 [Festuca glaucescens]